MKKFILAILVLFFINYTYAGIVIIPPPGAGGGDVSFGAGPIAEGSIPYADAAGDLLGDIAKIFWDDASSEFTVGGATSLLEMSAPTNTANYGKLYVKSSDSQLYFKDDGGTEIPISRAIYGDMHFGDNSTAIVIDTADSPHLVQGLFGLDIAKGVTFAAGSTGAITAFADATGGQVTVSSTTHGLSNGDIISISGTTSYNGVFTVDNVAASTYEITDTWVADDGASTWHEGDKFTLDTSASGVYSMSFHLSGFSAGSNVTHSFAVYKNDVELDLHSIREFGGGSAIGSVSDAVILPLVEGDVITFSISTVGGTTNFTPVSIGLLMQRIE